MSKQTNDQSSPPATNEAEIDKILVQAWDNVARKNPMLLASFKPDHTIPRLREIIRQCLAKGLTAEDICEQVFRDLLRPS